MLSRCALTIVLLILSQVLLNSYTTYIQSSYTDATGAPAPIPAIRYQSLVGTKVGAEPPSVPVEPTAERALASSRELNLSCQHGGVETSRGCICGRGTTGLSCEGLDESALLSSPEGSSIQVCGPDCWPVYVWYPTDNFKFRPITQEPRDDLIRSTLAELLAWRDGGELREQGAGAEEAGQDDIILDEPTMHDIVTSLGPWSEADKHMARLLGRFRRDLRSGLITTVPPPEPPRVEGVRIVFGLMLHDNLPRFEALWRVLFNEDHYFLVHIDRTPEDPAVRQQIWDVIDNTKCQRGGSVWDRVFVLDEEDSVDSLWGDITLVYSEINMYIALLRQSGWDWDYFINVSGADVPVMRHEEMAAFLGSKAPHSFLYHHENKDEFRQTYLLPTKKEHKIVIVYSALQKDMQPGRYRERIGITRLWGCSQWHVLHRRMLTEFMSSPEVNGLLFSLRFTSIPDESFFGAAAVWLREKDPERYPITPWDLRYWNEVRMMMVMVTMVMVMVMLMAWRQGFHRDISEKGELRAIKELADLRQILFARKSNTAIVTCAFTNRLLNISNDCSPYAATGKMPDDALRHPLPRREDP
jgi:hypothetical protein